MTLIYIIVIVISSSILLMSFINLTMVFPLLDNHAVDDTTLRTAHYRMTNIRNIAVTIDMAMILPLLIGITTSIDLVIIIIYSCLAIVYAVYSLRNTLLVHSSSKMISTDSFLNHTRRTEYRFVVISVLKLPILIAFILLD